MSVAKKSIAVSIQLGMSVRNFVLTDILSDIQAKGHDVTVITSSVQIKDAIGTKFPVVLVPKINRIEARILQIEDQINYIAFYLRTKNSTIHKYIKRDRQLSPFIWGLKSIAARAVNTFPILAWLTHRFVARKFETTVNKFDALLCLSFNIVDDRLLLLCRSSKDLKNLVAVHSWDNLPSRGSFSGKIDQLFVWNNEMVRQAKTFHSFEQDKVSLIGVPQFQHMLRLSGRGIEASKIDKRLSDKKFIVYCASATRVFPDEELFVNGLIDICKKLGLIFVLRMHPNERVKLYQDKYRNDVSVVLSAASSFFSAGVPKTAIEGQPDQEFMAFTYFMSQALAVINLASTTSLDAMVFGTPIICPIFNPNSSLRGAWNEAARWYESVHFSAVVSSGAIELVKDFQQIETHLNNYLSGVNPRKEASRKFMNDFSPQLSASQVLSKFLEEKP